MSKARAPQTKFSAIAKEAIDLLLAHRDLTLVERLAMAQKLKPFTRPGGARGRPRLPANADDAWTVWHLVNEYGYAVKPSCAVVLQPSAPMSEILALKARYEELKHKRQLADVVRWDCRLLQKPLTRLRAKPKSSRTAAKAKKREK